MIKVFQSVPLASLSDINVSNNKLTLIEYIDKTLNEYLQVCIGQNILDKEEIIKLSRINEMIIESISLHLNGLVGPGYNKFLSLMEFIEEDLKKVIRSQVEKNKLSKYVELHKTMVKNGTMDNLLDTDDQIELINDLYDLSLSSYESNLFYKCRKSKEVLTQKEDIFHIPFSSANKIGNNRFSVQGYPCLYLGSSFSVCYYEIGEPPLEDIWISKYIVSDNLKYIDLSLDLNRILELLNELVESDKYTKERVDIGIRYLANRYNLFKPIKNLKTKGDIYSYNSSRDYMNQVRIIKKKSEKVELRFNAIKGLMEQRYKDKDNYWDMVSDILKIENKVVKISNVYWGIGEKFSDIFISLLFIYPLQLISTIKKSESEVFVPEYILPQYLMQWIREKKLVDGVKYVSTKCPNEADLQKFINLAVPAKSNENEYCTKLLSLFEYDHPTRVIDDVNLSSLISKIDKSYSENDFSYFIDNVVI